MIIAHGSLKNTVKSSAVMRGFGLYASQRPEFLDPLVISVDVDSGVGPQPRDLETIIAGAANRARRSAVKVAEDYGLAKNPLGVGIESGLFRLEQPRLAPVSGREFWMDVSACGIYDGDQVHFGFSPAFMVPPAVMKFVLEDGLDLSAATKAAGLTTEEYVGYGKGIVGILTGGVVTREDYTVQAVLMAIAALPRS